MNLTGIYDTTMIFLCYFNCIKRIFRFLQFISCLFHILVGNFVSAFPRFSFLSPFLILILRHIFLSHHFVGCLYHSEHHTQPHMLSFSYLCLIRVFMIPTCFFNSFLCRSTHADLSHFGFRIGVDESC